MDTSDIAQCSSTASGTAHYTRYSVAEKPPPVFTGHATKLYCEKKAQYDAKHGEQSGEAKVVKKQTTENDYARPTMLHPDYTPTKDCEEHKLWDGERKALHWHKNVKAEMAKTESAGCNFKAKGTACGSKDDLQIDHIHPFSEEQTMLPTVQFCDGKFHWTAVHLEDALDAYNGGIKAADEKPAVEGKFQWLCARHNASKGGKKWKDKGVPVANEACNCRFGESNWHRDPE